MKLLKCVFSFIFKERCVKAQQRRATVPLSIGYTKTWSLRCFCMATGTGLPHQCTAACFFIDRWQNVAGKFKSEIAKRELRIVYEYIIIFVQGDKWWISTANRNLCINTASSRTTCWCCRELSFRVHFDGVVSQNDSSTPPNSTRVIWITV